VVLGVVCGLICLHTLGGGPGSSVVHVLAGALAIALLGLVDDFHDLSSLLRLAIQAAVAVAVVMVSGQGTLPGIDRPFAEVLTVLWLVALTNAFNFMDGIDGIAGAQALVAGSGWLFVGLLSGSPDVAALGLLLGGASAGFLLHNWHPAKVFMGDAGSGFFGFLFAALPLVAASATESPWVVAALLMWPFLADTAVTLARRVCRREDIFSAHRSHFYQRLVVTGRSHRYVALLYAALAVLGGVAAIALVARSMPALLTSLVAIVAAAAAVWWKLRSREASPGGLGHATV
jgi:UDP-N-acetylmuramyl pentapeptide phosphotransferase/UDP-N-acetylglucosamine-1-phosphate transferase